MQDNYKKNQLVDILFWILFIIFTNPGGMLEAFGEDSGDGGINATDFIFAALMGCYALILHKKDTVRNVEFNKIGRLLIFFIAYYFIVFGYMVPELKGTASSTFTFVVIKSRSTLYSVLLFFMVYKFFRRSYIIFFKVFLFSSIIIITLFLVTLITGADILPIQKADRGFVKIDRIFLVSYGLMPILIPMGAALIAFKININWRKYIIIGFSLMFLAWLLSLTRRHIFGTIVYLILALMIFNYFQKKVLLPIGKLASTLIYAFIILFFISLAFPKYVEAGKSTIEETFYVIQYGESTTGRKDERLGFGRGFLVELIEKNLFFGTGFDNRWRTQAGDAAGYETSDYPLLASFAMHGIFGVLLFLPVYIILIKTLRKDFNFFRNNDTDYNSFIFYIQLFFILIFTYDLLQYMNWFKPLSRSTDYEWYVFLSMYLSSRALFYENYKLEKKLEIKT